MSDLLQDVAPHFAPLLSKHRFTIVDERYDRTHFGNILVVADSNDFRLRFTRDRGQILVEIASAGAANWTDLSDLLRAVDPASDYSGDYSREHVGVLAHGVARYYVKLCELMRIR
jgi:hypothetical protein